MNDLERLRMLYSQGKVILFVGAGISASVEWKDQYGTIKRGIVWEDMVKQATRMLGYENADLLRCRGNDLQVLEYFCLKNGNEGAKLTNWLKENLNPDDASLRESKLHSEIANFSKKCRLIYTTNYDNFLERALTLAGVPLKSIATEQDMGDQGDNVQVIKFHGDFDNPKQIVMSESEYEKRLSLDKVMDMKLSGDLLGRVALFIGYSFRDPNVSYLFRMFTEKLAVQAQVLTGKRSFITFPDPSDFEVTLFENRQMGLLRIDSDHMVEGTVKLLQSIRGL